MSGPKRAPQKAKPAADPSPAERLAIALNTLAGRDWRSLRYGAAVSGGGDSMVLLALLQQLLPSQIEAATVDHQLRSASADEAEMVAHWCRTNAVPHCILRPVMPIKGSLQAEARAVRYTLLEQWRRDQGLDFILTAHHADDQLETLIMRLNRSSGVGGLAGIRAQQGTVLRPLLGWRRGALSHWAKVHAVPFVDDPANADPRFDRARLRTALGGQRLLDPEAVTRSAGWLDQADQALDWTVESLIAAWPDTDDPTIIRDANYPDELFRRIVARQLRCNQPGLLLRGIALDGVMRAMREGRRAMVGALLIDPAMSSGGSAWRISAAPRRKSGQK